MRRLCRVCIINMFLLFCIPADTFSSDIITAINDTITAALETEDAEVGIEKWSGINLACGYSGIAPFPGVETILWYTFGFDIYTLGYYGLPDGGVYTGSDPGVDPEEDVFYTAFRSQVSFGASQGILWNDHTDKNLLEWYIFYRLQNDHYFMPEDTREDHLLSQSTLPEKDGFLLSYFISGFTLSTEYRRRISRIREGVAVDVGGSWSPGYSLNTIDGQTFNYGGLHADFRGFFPYFEIESKKNLNLFSLYHAFWFRVDYVFGPAVPVQVLQSLSGRSWKSGLGGAVRGVDSNRYPAPLKIAASTELRFHLPAADFLSICSGLPNLF